MPISTPRFRKRIATITATGASTTQKVGFGGVKYGKVLGFRADITSGTDATTTIGISDALGRVLYLDAAAKDYTTAVNRVIVYDDTLTGINFTPTDATGAALAAGQAWAPVVEGPLTITWGSATTGEVLRIELIVEA